MPFMPPNQQRQNTEGKVSLLVINGKSNHTLRWYIQSLFSEQALVHIVHTPQLETNTQDKTTWW